MTKIKNMDEIKLKLQKVKLPEEFILSESEKVNDVSKFIDSSLCILSVDKLRRVHRPYFDRFQKILNSVKIKIELDDKKV